MKKYNTEEERKAAKKAAYKKWYLSHLEYNKERGHKRNIEEREKRSEYNKKYRAEHKEYYQEYMKKWEHEHKEERKEYAKSRDNSVSNNRRRATMDRKANALSQDYRYADNGRGFNTENNVDGKWIEENIYTSRCVYCGDSNWKHLGCDRIDNSRPHTADNVVCSCGICNIERQGRKMSVEEFVEYRKTHPRGIEPPKLQEIAEINGKKVIRKRMSA